MFHKPANNNLIFAPSSSNNAEDWNWNNQIVFNDNGTVSASGFIKNGSSNDYLLLGDGSHKSISDFALSAQLNNYVLKSGDTMTGGLIIRTPDSLGSNNLGALPTNLKLFLSNGSSYGTVFWSEGTGDGYIQQQRADGNPIAYPLNLQPYGGSLFYGNNEVATVNQIPNVSNFVTINTPQTIIANKNFTQTSDVRFLGNEENEVRVWRESSGAGNGCVVSGHILNWYGLRWKVGHQRGGGSESGGYGFWLSTDNGSTYERRVEIKTDGIIYTSLSGNSLQWDSAYNWGNHANAGYANYDFVEEKLNEFSGEITNPDSPFSIRNKFTTIIITEDYHDEPLYLYGELVPESSLSIINLSKRIIDLNRFEPTIDRISEQETTEYYINKEQKLIKKGSYRNAQILT